MKMTSFNAQTETETRISLVKNIDKYVNKNLLSGLLITGSLSWGKNKAVTASSDIDFYLLSPSLKIFQDTLDNLPTIPLQTKNTLKKMFNYNYEQVDTRSIKTNIGQYFGAIYFFTEKDLSHLVGQFNKLNSVFFKNLRPHNFAQTKEYKSINGNKTTYTTPIVQASRDNDLWIRTDPVSLIKNNDFYGSIFLSHLLFGEAYTDKNGSIHMAQLQARKFLKSLLPENKSDSFKLFKNYLPRIERMDDKTIKKLFESIWKS